MAEDNVIPINAEAQQALHDLTQAQPADSIDNVLTSIESLRLDALLAMSGLIKHWAHGDPRISEAASRAISDVIEATHMKPPTSS